MPLFRGSYKAVVLAALSLGVFGVTAATQAKVPPTSRPMVVRRRVPAAVTVDQRAVALIRRVTKASRAAKTMTADFTYSVTAVDRQQLITGTVRMMKPNYVRVNFSYLAEPAYPNIVASDGTTLYTFTPSSFQTKTRTFVPGPFDTLRGAQAASGLIGAGGTITSAPVSAQGSDIRLWDSIAVQAFFDPDAALRYLYYQNPNEIRYEGEKVLDGVRYRVLYHHFANGSIAGGAHSAFEQRLYIGPDDLIHRYVLEFTSQGRPGVQVMRLENIRVNTPMTAADFAFAPPAVE